MIKIQKALDVAGTILIIMALTLLAAVSCVMMKVLLYCMVNLLAM